MEITRRKFLKQSSAAGIAFSLYGFSNAFGSNERMINIHKNRRYKKCLVLGIDGLDQQILTRLMQDNKLPNFTKLANQGTFTALGTSNPAMSPVAWSNIASGVGPEYHGIFDFLHRNPATYTPYLSLRNSSSGLLGTKYRKARQCNAFWNYTSDADIPTTVIRWPVTFPAEKVNGRFLSGLGTPDLLGGEGQYYYYTTKVISSDDPSPHNIISVNWQGRIIRTILQGPAIGRGKYAKSALIINKKSSNAASITLGDAPVIEAERNHWTQWVKISFSIGLRRIYGMVRFLLLESEPDLKLFVSPINLVPGNQTFEFTYPEEFGRQLEEKTGAFHTLGMPEMIHPLSHKRYGFDEFLEQVKIIENERTEMFLGELEQFENGLLAFVFDHTDRLQHALWSTRDVHHPSYDKKEANLYGDVINRMYEQTDDVLGKAMKRTDRQTLLFVLSDHGFGSFRRQVHLNRWLIENNYMHLKECDQRQGKGLFEDVDWEKTKAYATGFASMYINMTGREGCGIIEPGAKYNELCREIASRLGNLIDPKKGNMVVRRVYRSDEVFTNSPLTRTGPDLLVGLNPGYRFSWQTALGAAPAKLIEDNTSKWSGDHIFDPSFMSGVLLSNIKIDINNPRGIDIAPNILKYFNLKPPAYMTGKSLSI